MLKGRDARRAFLPPTPAAAVRLDAHTLRRHGRESPRSKASALPMPATACRSRGKPWSALQFWDSTTTARRRRSGTVWLRRERASSARTGMTMWRTPRPSSGSMSSLQRAGSLSSAPTTSAGCGTTAIQCASWHGTYNVWFRKRPDRRRRFVLGPYWTSAGGRCGTTWARPRRGVW